MSAPLSDVEIVVEQDGFDVHVAGDEFPPELVIVEVGGPQGPAGPAGDGGFTHTQSSPAATWTITNSLGRYPASVLVVVDQALVDAQVEFPDVDTVVITFASPQSGRAEII